MHFFNNFGKSVGLGLSEESGKYNGLGLFFKEEVSDGIKWWGSFIYLPSYQPSMFNVTWGDKASLFVVRWAIWYHLYILKNVKNTLGGVLLLVSWQLY